MSKHNKKIELYTMMAIQCTPIKLKSIIEQIPISTQSLTIIPVQKDLIDEKKLIELYCPHCYTLVIFSEDEINCQIFRHAIYKTTGKQIPPHSSKEVCDKLILENSIWGCGKPFKMVKEDVWKLVICDYI
jgi:hypothetical protein